MKKVKIAVVGAGNRGCVYCDYVFDEPNEVEIVAVVDVRELARKEAGERYNIPQGRQFASLDDFLAANIQCDLVINATMDEMHYETAKKIMQGGYNLLQEKPIVPNKEQLLELRDIAEKNHLKVNVCHVLRYTPFYKKIKEIINEGIIGTIISLEMNEHVEIAHFVDSFIRGKWNSEKKCGSGFLLAKSCHDMDLLCWLNNQTVPKNVTSVGSRSLFIKENAPKGATKFCYQCPYNDTCLYSAQKIHLEMDPRPFQTWLDMNKPLDQITKEEKAEWLKMSDYGLCAYDSGGDINDRQVVTVEFENGSVGTFTMLGGACKAGRNIHICGTKGEIEGNLESGKFILRTFDRSEGKFEYVDYEIDVNKDVKISVKYGGHSGGDYAIMNETVRYLNGDNSSISITKIDDSINGHLLVYAAEESVKSGMKVRVK